MGVLTNEQWCSLLGPMLANAFLCHFEKQWLSECFPDILSKVLKRYADDIFAMFLCQSHLKDFMNYMNTKHPNIKFTLEFEKNYSFSFLDVRIKRSNNQLVTSVFCKATFSGVYINFKSFFTWSICIWLSLYFTSSFFFPFALHMKKTS